MFQEEALISLCISRLIEFYDKVMKKLASSCLAKALSSLKHAYKVNIFRNEAISPVPIDSKKLKGRRSTYGFFKSLFMR